MAVNVTDIVAATGDDLRRRLADIDVDAGNDQIIDGILHRFTAELSGRRQQTLGVSHYIWRSADDDRVRGSHIARDDQTFSWDERPTGGFPGEDFGCRCYTEPLIHADVCNPKTGGAYSAMVTSAAMVGYYEALKDTGVDLVTGVFDLANLALDTVDFAVSELAVQLGLAGEEREAEVARVHTLITDELENYEERLAQLQAALAEVPDLARAFSDYVEAVFLRTEQMTAAYGRCEVSETELREAIREDAYLRASVVMVLIPTAATVTTIIARVKKLLGALGASTAGLKGVAILRLMTQKVRAGIGALRVSFINRDYVDWGEPIHVFRGLSYERSLATRRDRYGLGTWLETETRNHPGVDFFNFSTRQATSVKTLNLAAFSYQTPSQIYGTLSRYLRSLVRFNGGKLIERGEIRSKMLILAVPSGGTPEQMKQIGRAIDLATQLGIEMIVEVTR